MQNQEIEKINLHKFCAFDDARAYLNASWRIIQRKSVALLAELPQCTIWPNGLNGAHFSFNGGYGFLIPCSK